MNFDLILPFLRPIEPLLLDESVSEIMGNPDASWWYERDGIVSPEASVQFDSGRLRTGLEVIANHLGKRLDEDNPLLHAQLPDGSRLAAVIPPVVRPSPALTIRKFTSRRYTVDDLIARGTLSRSLANYLSEQIRGGNRQDRLCSTCRHTRHDMNSANRTARRFRSSLERQVRVDVNSGNWRSPRSS
jgi:pilus assembly protein CpaF